MAWGGGRIITLKELVGEDTMPLLVLRPNPERNINFHAEVIINVHFLIEFSSKLSVLQSFKRENQQFVVQAEREFAKLEQPADSATTKRNQERFIKIIDGMKNNFNENMEAKKAVVLEEMVNMTPQQQQDAIGFWLDMSDFLKSIVDWIGRVFDRMLKMLRDGWTLVRDTTRQFFQSIIDYFNGMF